MHLASPEACFQATSAADCHNQVKRWMGAGSVSLTPFRSVLESLCQKSLKPVTFRSIAYLGPLNLFALTSGKLQPMSNGIWPDSRLPCTAFHALIFQYQNSFGGSSQLLPIQHALINWKDIWQIYSDAFSLCSPHNMVADRELTPDTMSMRIGFSRHAAEFWLLSSLIMDHISATNDQNQQTPLVPGLKEPQQLAEGPPEPILHQYDQTSMRQVNDLISVFQKVQI